MNNKQKISILLIEDDSLDRVAFESTFKDANLSYTLETTNTITAAKDRLSHENVDLILLNQKLPDEPRLQRQQFEGIPIIFLTGDVSMAVQAMNAGAYDFLVKDRNRDYLQLLPITIEKALNRKRDEKELEQYRLYLEEAVQLHTVALQKANKHLSIEITKQVETNERLRKSEGQFRSVTTNASDAIISINSHGQITLMNQATQTMFGITEKELLGQQLTKIIPKRYQNTHHKALERLRAGTPAR
ncbi:MAG: PAS domain S-box protein, partial [Chloroflexi bacterium]|nr:PAS domain S-box protein [Chloroflexota bacterium]